MSTGWFGKSRLAKDASPIGENAKRFILENCEYSLLLRQDRRFKCVDHWDESSNSAQYATNICSVCMGFGYKMTPQIVPARFSGTSDTQLRFIDGRNPLGELAMGGVVAYFPREVKPGGFDILARCEWDIDTRDISKNNVPRIINLREVFLIRSTFTHFEREISFISATLGTYPTEIDTLARNLAAVSDIEVMELAFQKAWW